MTKTVKIHGYDVELFEPNGDGMVTDVVVITRIVYSDIQDDMITVMATQHTTSTVETGMLTKASREDANIDTTHMITHRLMDEDGDDID